MKTNKKIIIGLSGEIACGKGAVVDYLVKKHKASSYRYSRILRDILDRVYEEQSRKNMTDLSDWLRKKFGQDILSKTLARDITRDKNKLIVFDGIRRVPELNFFKKIPGFILIRIVGDQKIRYARFIKRNENPGDNKKTYRQFLKDLKGLSDYEIPKVMKQADYEINNDGSLKDLHRQIDQIILKG
ncbi:MAG: AAA family ATPase [bacterium]|nr:AAA family ATPase [bacterium]